MRSHYYVYGILFPKKDLEIGLFSIDVNIFEGNTDENVVAMLHVICEKMGWDIEKIKSYTFKKVSDQYLKEMLNEAGVLRGPGNDGSEKPVEPNGGTGGGGVPSG